MLKPPAKQVVMIVFDFMGYGDIEPFGKGEIRTPNIRRLAEQGIRYSDCYASSPVCVPSRASIFTGYYPRHLGIEDNIHHGEPGLQVTEKSLSRYFKDAGYYTALYGKWHLGYEAEESPNAHGFDDFLGFNEWNVDYYTHKSETGEDALYHNGEMVKREGYMTDVITDAAVDLINEKASEPFFLFASYNSMLPPYSPPGGEDSTASFASGINGSRADYVAAVEHLDKSVGRILDAIKQQGLEQDTIVLLTYDHGGGDMATKGPFFHGFGTLWEGGIRVPMIIKWPDAMPDEGSIVEEPVILMDAAVTLLAAAGIIPGKKLDGINLLDPNQMPKEPRTLFWRTDFRTQGDHWCVRSQRAVRQGDWKYLWDGLEFLFNLKEDPGERENLSYRHPELLTRLRDLSNGDW